MNPIYKLYGFGKLIGLLLMGLSIFTVVSIVAPAQTTTGSANTAILSVICNVFDTIKNVIFILGLALMILGGAVYAGANLMPSSARGGFQGYGMAMIIGGIIGVAIAVAAPFILSVIINSNQTGASQVLSSGTSVCTGSGSVA